MTTATNRTMKSRKMTPRILNIAMAPWCGLTVITRGIRSAGDLVAAALLGTVEGLVGRLDHLGGASQRLAGGRDADADGDRDGLTAPRPAGALRLAGLGLLGAVRP